MAELLLPGNVRREIQKREWVEQRRQYRARLDQLLDFEDPVCVEWNKVIPPDFGVKLARARPMAYEPGWNVIPGFYHWVRDNEGAPPTVAPIHGDDDEGNATFKEPTSAWLERLKASDLQNPQVFAALLGQQELHEKRLEREKLEAREERQNEILERYIAGNRTQVSTTDVPWTQSARGRKQKKAR